MTDHSSLLKEKNNSDIVERLKSLSARLDLEGRAVSVRDCEEAAAEITKEQKA